MTRCSTCTQDADRWLTVRDGDGYTSEPRCGRAPCQVIRTVLFPIGQSYRSVCKTVGPDHFHNDMSEIRS